MSRLTESEIDIKCFSDKAKSRLTNDYIEKVKLNNKLCKLEDIMEKYGIDVEELDFRLAMKQNTVANYKEITKLENDRDTWKKACELACEEIGLVEAKFNSAYIRPTGYLTNYFYQQVQKENK